MLHAQVWRRSVLACFAFLLPLVLAAAPAKIQHGGDAYVNTEWIAARLGMEHRTADEGREARLSSEWTKITVERHQRYITLNGIKVYLGNVVLLSRGDLYISEVDFQKSLSPILTPQLFKPVPSLTRIVIDPGHGGKDPGAQNGSLKLAEKHLVLDVAKRLQKELEAAGYIVHLTRTDDEFIELKERAAKANAWKADLFISLHFNATSASSVRGVETFVHTLQGHASSTRSKVYSSDHHLAPANRNDAWNALAGYYVQRELLGETKAPDRGLKRARFAVLKNLECPGVLIEAGFVSNTFEGKNIGWSAYRQRLAEAIARGVQSYQKTINRIRE